MKLKVLVVDDDPITVFIHTQNVIKIGLSSDPLTFLDGKATLNYLEKHTDNDEAYFILLDINMPEMNGWQFLQALNDIDIDQVYVVVVSSSVDSRDHQKAYDFKTVIGYLEKPMSADVLQTFTETSAFDVVRNLVNSNL